VGARTRASLIVGVALLALALRVGTLWRTVDTPGDGSSRAILAYQWARAPYLAVADTWLPGFMYLAGTFSRIVDDPEASRILNVALGTLTVPLFFLLIERLFGVAVAFGSSVLLALFPLHVGLSASSLTEPSLLLAMMAGLYLLVVGPHTPHLGSYRVGAALACFGYAEMVRYEAWLLVAPVPFYIWWRSRDRQTAVLAGAALLVFPAFWMLGCTLYLGDPLAGIHAATRDLGAGTRAIGVLPALASLGTAWVAHFGWLIPACVAWGFVTEGRRAVRFRLDAARALYLGVAATFWLTMARFAMTRGADLFNRYLLFGFVAALPFAFAPLLADSRERAPLRRAAVALVVAIASHQLSLPYLRAHPERYFTPLWVTSDRPAVIERVAAWIERSPHADDAMLATEMHWLSTYVPLYRVELAGRFLVVSDWIDDGMLRGFVETNHPSLLLTADGDERLQERVASFLGVTLDTDRLLYADGAVKVFAIGGSARSVMRRSDANASGAR
jgi:hypothetical protein